LRKIIAIAVLVLVQAGCNADAVSAPPDRPVASVALPADTLTVLPGASVQLNAVLTDASGSLLTGRTVTWSTSAALIAAVSASGLVTGIIPGTAVVTATSEGAHASAVVTVLQIPVARITVTPGAVSVSVGRTLSLSATTLAADGSNLGGRIVSWQSANPDIVAVSSSGVLTGIAVGGPVLVVATVEGVSTSASITVTPPVVSIAITPPDETLVIGTSLSLSAIPRDAAGVAMPDHIVTWQSSSPGIASVSASGVVVGVVVGGPVTITASSDGVSASHLVTVIPIPVASVLLSQSNGLVQVGRTLTLSATLRDGSNHVLTGRTVTWTSSDVGIATVSGNGVVTGISPGGPVAITASSDGKTAAATITIIPMPGPVASVWVAPPNPSIVLGNTVQLAAILQDTAFTDLTDRAVVWTSSAPAVASVSPSGLVTAIAVGGPVGITATSEGKSGSAQVFVVSAIAPPPPPPPQITTMNISTVTTGADPDPDGYVIIHDYPSQLIAVGANATTTVTAGIFDNWTHTFTITGIDPNCVATNPTQTFDASQSETITLVFTVTCQSRAMPPLSDPLVGVWQAERFELFRDAGLTSRLVELVSRGESGTLVLGATVGAATTWQWREDYNGTPYAISGGNATVTGSILSSVVTLHSDAVYCCGPGNNSPLGGQQSFARAGDELVITSTTPQLFSDDYGNYPVYVRLTLRKVR
jgi:uncharacterized protein YjdB